MHMYKTPMKEAGGGRQKDHTHTQARGGVGGGQHFVTQSWEHGDEAKGGAEGKHGVGPQSPAVAGDTGEGTETDSRRSAIHFSVNDRAGRQKLRHT